MSHFITSFILLILPIISIFEVRKLKSNISDRTKESAYWRIYFWYIIASVLITLDRPISELFYHTGSIELPTIINLILWTVVSYHIFMLVVPTVLVYFSKRMQEATRAAYEEKDYMFPRSRKSLIMFTVLAFIVGVSEEMIFRGYLYSYMQEYWGVSAFISLVIVNVVFGLLHFHQGRSAMIDTATLGLAMSQLYIQSGSLLLPIIFHILYDLKIVIVTRKLGMHKTHQPV